MEIRRSVLVIFVGYVVHNILGKTRAHPSLCELVLGVPQGQGISQDTANKLPTNKVLKPEAKVALTPLQGYKLDRPVYLFLSFV